MPSQQQVTIGGCGIVGAMIAYELSQVPGLAITVCDRQPGPAPANGTQCPTATGAALGVLMGVTSKKSKGNNLQLRLASLQTYETLIPQLVAQTGRVIPVNHQGLVMLQFADDDLARWEDLVKIRYDQGWPLEIWSSDRLKAHLPHFNYEQVSAGVYSPRDRQIDPIALTQALIAAAQQNGVLFCWSTEILGLISSAQTAARSPCQTVQTTTGDIATDWLIIAAGLGSTPLTQTLGSPLLLQPVLGQAIHLRLAAPLSHPLPQPVVTGHDVNFVPLGDQDYWVGATIEFPLEATPPQPNPADFAALMAQAIALFPALATATTQRTWQGLRPRPQGRPAPVIERLSGHHNVILATGHYRNGVLLAPATAAAVQQIIMASS